MAVLNIRHFCDIIRVVAPSSSGPGRLVLIQKIAGSTPAGVTKRQRRIPQGFLFCLFRRRPGDYLPQESPRSRNNLLVVFFILDNSIKTEPAKRVRVESSLLYLTILL